MQEITKQLDRLYERKQMLATQGRDFDKEFSSDFEWLMRRLEVQHQIDVLEARAINNK